MISTDNFFAKHLTVPLWEKMRGISVRKPLGQYERTYSCSSEELSRFQRDKMLKLAEYSLAHVPYYRNMEIDSASLRKCQTAQEILSLFPVLSREILSQNAVDLISDEHAMDTLEAGSSSGSSGVPITFWKDKIATSAAETSKYFGWQRAGFYFGARSVTVWGNRKTVTEIWPKIPSRLKAALFHQRRIAACNLTSFKDIRTAIAEIKSFGPEFIDGYTNAIFLLAKEWLSLGESCLNCRAVFTTAETLLESHKTIIQAAFGSVFDQYGCSEINGIAFQCPDCGDYHITAPHVLVEYEPSPDSEAKSILVTNLDNYGMPFIRYRIRDTVLPARTDCPSGTAWPSLKGIAGRLSDSITLRDGTIVNPIMFFGDTLGRALYKVFERSVHYQTVWDGSFFIIRIAAAADDMLEQTLLSDSVINAWGGVSIPHKFERVNFIQPSETGKTGYFINESGS